MLMRVLGFNLEIVSSLNYVLHFVRQLEGSKELAHLSFYLLNDSFCSTICLQYKPEVKIKIKRTANTLFSFPIFVALT